MGNRKIERMASSIFTGCLWWHEKQVFLLVAWG